MRRRLPRSKCIHEVFFRHLAAALLAAVCAHVGIDVLGDWLVRDDAYDHVGHASRLIVMLIAIAIGTGALPTTLALGIAVSAPKRGPPTRLSLPF